MSARLERLTRMVHLLRSRGAMTKQALLSRFEISEPTFKRDLQFLRDRMGAEIVYDSFHGRYHLKEGNAAGSGLGSGTSPSPGRTELPGVWMSREELTGLLTLHQLLQGLGTGELLDELIQPIRSRVESLLADLQSAGAPDSGQDAQSPEQRAQEIARRIRILPMGRRSLNASQFGLVAAALLQRRQLQIRYEGRGRAEETERVISPQRLVHYRDNWYLDAWCHLRQDLRVFSLDAIRHAEMLDAPAESLSPELLEATLSNGYGIFSGPTEDTVRLRFSPERSRWVASETWHPQQTGVWRDDCWELSFPYSDTRELIGDILRHGPEVQVLAPPSLAEQVRALHLAAAQAG